MERYGMRSRGLARRLRHPAPRQRGGGTARSAVGGARAATMFLAATTKRHLRRPLHRASARSPSPACAGADKRSHSRAAFLAGEPSNRSFLNSPLTNAGPSLLLPFATYAKGSGTPTGVGSNLRTGQVRRRANAPASPVGVPPRLSPRGLTSPKAQLRPCFLRPGLMSVAHHRLSQSSEHLARRS